MQEHIALGREYPSIDLNTSYSFGLDDQEFVVAFETDDPGSFLDLVQRLRTTESSSFTLRDTPTFTCISASVERALSALDGETIAAQGRLSAMHEAPGEIRDITVIGAGPVGLSTAFWAGMREASARIVDSLPQIGGQLTALYPEKWIFDVPGHPKILAKDLVEQLRRQTLEQFDVPVHLETTIETIEWEDDIVVLNTNNPDYPQLRSRAVIIAGGHGAFEPKRLPGFDMTPWEGRGAHYLVGSKSEFAGKKVLIIGGGDSACDWVINLLHTAESVALCHRREGFRAHELTVNQVMTAADAGHVDLHVPFQVREVIGNGAIERVRLFHSEDETREIEIEVDAILLQLGFKTALGPLKNWGLEISKGALVVDQVMKTNLAGVWACGDITTFDGKLKLIATGFAEAAVAVAQAVPLLPARDEDPAEVLDEHRRAGRRRRPALTLRAGDHRTGVSDPQPGCQPVTTSDGAMPSRSCGSASGGCAREAQRDDARPDVELVVLVVVDRRAARGPWRMPRRATSPAHACP